MQERSRNESENGDAARISKVSAQAIEERVREERNNGFTDAPHRVSTKAMGGAESLQRRIDTSRLDRDGTGCCVAVQPELRIAGGIGAELLGDGFAQPRNSASAPAIESAER